MNRKQRRATLKRGSPAGARGAEPGGDRVKTLFSEAVGCERAPQVRRCRAHFQARAVAQAGSCRGLQQSRTRAAGARQTGGRFLLFCSRARLDAAAPEAICRHLHDTRCSLAPAGRGAPPSSRRLAKTIERARAVRRRWARRDRRQSAAAAASSIPVQDIALERLLTSLRSLLLTAQLPGRQFPTPFWISPTRSRSNASSMNMSSPPRPKKMHSLTRSVARSWPPASQAPRSSRCNLRYWQCTSLCMRSGPRKRCSIIAGHRRSTAF